MKVGFGIKNKGLELFSQPGYIFMNKILSTRYSGRSILLSAIRVQNPHSVLNKEATLHDF